MKITYNDLDGSAPVVGALNGQIRLFDGRAEEVPAHLEAQVLARLANNPFFVIEQDEAQGVDGEAAEKEALIAEIEALGGNGDRRMSVKTLTAKLAELKG